MTGEIGSRLDNLRVFERDRSISLRVFLIVKYKIIINFLVVFLGG